MAFADGYCLQEGDKALWITVVIFLGWISKLFLPLTSWNLIVQVKEMKELSEGYNIVGLSQVNFDSCVFLFHIDL